MQPFKKRLAKMQKSILRNVHRAGTDDDYSVSIACSYLTGVYLAVNALSDARLVVEGPDCTHMKTQFVLGNHDLMSTLISATGYHRVANTALHVSMMTGSREEGVRELMLNVAAHPTTAGLLFTSMPVAFVTGVDYERLCREVAESSEKPVIHVRGLSLRGDWLDGYGETLRSLAKHIELPKGRQQKATNVAIVGYLLDRNEWDHEANLVEIEEMCRAAGLDIVSVWLSGQRFSELSRVAEAGTILSLPYGRKAARQLARRTGATVIELPLPFGLGATEQWLLTLGEAFGTSESAERFIDQKLSDIVPRLEWVIPFVFQNITAGYLGDPHMLPGFLDTIDVLGARFSGGVISNHEKHTAEIADLVSKHELLVNPRSNGFLRFATERLLEERLHLFVTNQTGLDMLSDDTAFFELGFPTHYRHALASRPYLGFAGFIAFVDDLANTLRHKEVELARQELLRKLIDTTPGEE